MKHFYLELREGEKVIKRKATTFAAHLYDWGLLEEFQEKGQNIGLVVSSAKEKTIL